MCIYKSDYLYLFVRITPLTEIGWKAPLKAVKKFITTVLTSYQIGTRS